jgi:hypothetical protein
MSEFHRRCDGHFKTLTVIKSSKGNIFGGYSPLAWQSTGGYQQDASKQTFLFSLKNPRDCIATRFDITSDGSYAIYCSADRLAFGSGHAIHVCDNCNTNKSNYTNVGNTFENKTGIDGKAVLDGENYFTVEEIEVFGPKK